MENEIKTIFSQASDKAQQLNSDIKTYIDSNGAYRCRKCGEIVKNIKYFKSPAMLKVYPHGMEVWCICKCKEEERKQIKAEIVRLERQAEMPRIKAECFKSPSMASMTFDRDDSPTIEASNLARRWVNNYERNVQSGKPISWIFYYGGTGTGKTFYAACIANAMLEKGYSVKMANAADIEAEVFGSEDKMAVYRKYESYDLLVLDDLAAERKNGYMYEILYQVVNDRYLAKKPMIITTNMTTEETVNPKDKQLERIMSRIYAYGYPIEIQGKDRRKQGAWK